ncbi:single-stranded DNA-binding protein, partial [Staphylococcus pseudintermedius]|nr:single-stranded DNA-binding protein [Staphylococcus pseudintermedius]
QPQQQRGQAPAQDNPFAIANGPIDIDDDDMPF